MNSDAVNFDIFALSNFHRIKQVLFYKSFQFGNGESFLIVSLTKL